MSSTQLKHIYIVKRFIATFHPIIGRLSLLSARSQALFCCRWDLPGLSSVTLCDFHRQFKGHAAEMLPWVIPTWTWVDSSRCFHDLRVDLRLKLTSSFIRTRCCLDLSVFNLPSCWPITLDSEVAWYVATSWPMLAEFGLLCFRNGLTRPG